MTIQITNRPTVWTHDCDECEYLGGIDRGPWLGDVYIHRHGFEAPTIIVRYGAGSEYWSSFIDDHDIAEAYSPKLYRLLGIRMANLQPR